MHILLSFLLVVFSGNIYDLSIPVIDGSTVQMSQFKGKKILIVNIASGSAAVSQISELDSLQSKFENDLIVILVPSNSFGREPMSDSDIRNWLQSTYDAHFVVGAKVNVVGDSAISLYSWLARKSENGLADLPVNENFQKFLISEDGKIVGIFSGEVRPLSDVVQNAVAAQYY